MFVSNPLWFLVQAWSNVCSSEVMRRSIAASKRLRRGELVTINNSSASNTFENTKQTLFVICGCYQRGDHFSGIQSSASLAERTVPGN